MMALPAILFLFVFHYIPLFGLILPFKDYHFRDGLWGSKWVGLKNFEYLFLSEDAVRATRNTIFYNIAFILIGTTICILIALMMFEMARRAVKVYQTLLLLPYFISWVVVSYILNAFLDMDYGMLNALLKSIGLEPQLWYVRSQFWPAILVFAHVWKGMGYTSLIYYAALMGLNPELFEAARVDGAGKLKQIWYISIPSLKPMISMMLIMNIGGMLNSDFGLFYNLPMDSALLYKTTDVLSTFTYRALISSPNIGMSAAANFFQSVAGFALVLIANGITKKLSEDYALF